MDMYIVANFGSKYHLCHKIKIHVPQIALINFALFVPINEQAQSFAF